MPIWVDNDVKGAIEPLMIAAVVHNHTYGLDYLQQFASRAYGDMPIMDFMERLQLTLATRQWFLLPFDEAASELEKER